MRIIVTSGGSHARKKVKFYIFFVLHVDVFIGLDSLNLVLNLLVKDEAAFLQATDSSFKFLIECTKQFFSLNLCHEMKFCMTSYRLYLSIIFSELQL